MQAQRRYASPAEPALPRDMPAPVARGSVGTLPLSAAAAASLASAASGAHAVRCGARGRRGVSAERFLWGCSAR